MNVLISVIIMLLAGQEDKETERLEQEIDKIKKELDEKISQLSKSSARTAFNPAITGFLNFASRWDDKTDDSLIDESTGKGFVRSLELDLRSAVDHFADAVAIIALEENSESELEVEAEEVYINLKKLPFVEGSPLGLLLKIGKFRPPIGINNQLHLHDNLWITRPRVISEFLGSESGNFFESGFSAPAIQGRIFLPSFGSSNTNELYAGVLNSGETALSNPDAISKAAYFSRINSFTQFTSSLDLTSGISGYLETGSLDMGILALDLSLRNRDPQKGSYKSWIAGGEIFSAAARNENILTGDISTETPLGAFGYIQYQLGWGTYLGVRYDYTEDKIDTDEITQSYSVYVTYYTSEFLRFRIGYERMESDNDDLDAVDTILFELNVVFGSHPTEPYWVNR
ncbi:MAG: hypothetical protein HY606_10790 [Planctomycetes bacterium]|nr:hypothetical protein [Planctomycetota bacterium]